MTATRHAWRVGSAVCAMGLVSLAGWGWAQDEGAPAAAPVTEEIVIKREALSLTDARVYRVPLQLQAGRSVELTAPSDGYVRSISVKAGQKVSKESAAVQMDDARAGLLHKRAKAQVAAAKLEKKLAEAKGDADGLALAEARLEAAEADLSLADLEMKRLTIRTPFGGDVHRVLVSEGDYVRAGQVLVVIADASRVRAELPVERTSAKAGGTVDFKIQDVAVKGKIEAVVPLAEKFDVLRELSDGLASALIDVDNGAGKFAVGQTVYVDSIPMAPVAQVPTKAVTNQGDGQRKVQVLRDNVVRNITVKAMAKVGTDRVYVSGAFLPGDEVVITSSKELADGTPLRQLLVTARPASNPATAATPAGAATKKPVPTGTAESF